MSYFDLNWKNYTKILSDLALEESWSNKTYPHNGILANYLYYTYQRLNSERKVVYTKNYAIFNTGLYNKYYEPLYAFQQFSKILFLNDYWLEKKNILERPEPANYFTDPELLIYDYHYPIDIEYEEILCYEENIEKFPLDILNNHDMLYIMKKAVENIKNRLKTDYKIAIPQYYDRKIQLLLPLCLYTEDHPDLAISVTRIDGKYTGHNILTLDQAYNNARMIARLDNTWLDQNSHFKNIIQNIDINQTYRSAI
jgi:hypothetical protein